MYYVFICLITNYGINFESMQSFDTEVVDNFHEHKCDPFFTGVDHLSGMDAYVFGMDAMSAPPQFEMVEYIPAEYEAVEYKEEVEFETVDYEEFKK